MTTPTRTWLGRAVFIAGTVGPGLFVAIFFVTADRGKGLLYIGGFLMVCLAVALAATAELGQRHARLAFKPQTTPGWWAVWLEVAAAVLAVAAPTVLDALPRSGERALPALQHHRPRLRAGDRSRRDRRRGLVPQGRALPARPAHDGPGAAGRRLRAGRVRVPAPAA